ncbi:tetratricopeptide repeat protein [Calothrix sp. NIES-3974]|uniref:tetratricopeptide repeat protein n=1 Tax=Calothrix sp. NIES-3974 TaxID=2005462 RepID=UPI000B5ED820|nr:tetratricopeptide repeat protein [Calothrix sp. NIES-3974]BAZ04454.1 hypothetical protein NIES3974_10930 [Calothrix sp. NIES-3974]
MKSTQLVAHVFFLGMLCWGSSSFPYSQTTLAAKLPHYSNTPNSNSRQNLNFSDNFIEHHSGWDFPLNFAIQLGVVFIALVIIFKFYKLTPSQANNLDNSPQNNLPQRLSNSYKKENLADNFNMIYPGSKNSQVSAIKKAYNCFEEGDIEGAIANFNRAISNNPNNAEIYSQRANFRHNKLKDTQGAIEDYNHAIEINPNNAYFYFWRSKVYQDLGNQRQALEDYNTAMRLTMDNNFHHDFRNSGSGKIVSR